MVICLTSHGKGGAFSAVLRLGDNLDILVGSVRDSGMVQTMLVRAFIPGTTRCFGRSPGFVPHIDH